LLIYLGDNVISNLRYVNEGLRLYLGADSGGLTADVVMASRQIRSTRLRCLLSYYYYQKVDVGEMFDNGSPAPSIMADSGAFSAMSLGVDISLEGYAQWVRRWGHLFDHYANLDVIGDAEATLANQKRLEDMGLRPMPVFHVNEPWEYLENYLESYDYVALGGLVPYKVNLGALMPWLIKAFKMLPKGKAYHGFGVTGWEILKSFPWASVDSTSWSVGYRYGRVPLFSPVEGKLVSAYLGDRASCFRYRKLFEYCGYDWKDFAIRERNNRAKIAGVSAVSYMRVEDWLNRRHGRPTSIYLATITGAYEDLVAGVNGDGHTVRNIRRHGQRDTSTSGTVPG
jgi:hypothetical protein